MRTSFVLLLLAVAGAAHAHPGHLAEADGHDHIVALAAGIGAILILVALLAPRIRRLVSAVRIRRRKAG